ncbi:unnamed protein product [Blepharisma stoltei]|uniref:RING-type domain-containing protein n=1 Tax=Blepharisma stoltei TaxID=1481888 RepID=A0AAU9INC2_9CILI|nr:unnamed protein product [Blepharisma stoltei]
MVIYNSIRICIKINMRPQYREKPSPEECEELKKLGLENDDINEAFIPLDLSEEKVPFTCIKKILECPLCGQILRDPLISKLCAHIFCMECILMHLNTSQIKDCPKCHVPLDNESNLDPAYFIESILAKIIQSSENAARGDYDI